MTPHSEARLRLGFIVRGHLVQSLPNHFGLLFASFDCIECGVWTIAIDDCGVCQPVCCACGCGKIAEWINVLFGVKTQEPKEHCIRLGFPLPHDERGL